MIVFDLKCANDHVFEVWFASSNAYEDQRARGLVACAICGSTDVAKAVMAPRLNAKANQRSAHQRTLGGSDAADTRTEVSVPVVQPQSPAMAVSNAPAPEVLAKLRVVIETLAKAQAEALNGSTWVGSEFADRARSMHYGEEDHAPIHGQADPQDAAALIEEGIAVAPLPFPVIPPKARH